VNLNRSGREYYSLAITTTASSGSPIPASGWEASFDGGTTWFAATVITENSVDYSAWLVAGDRAAVGTAVAVLSTTTSPLVRATDNPEIVVRSAPIIAVG
jgi:hypothetical protein